MEGFTVWFTGLTASGKTTVAKLVGKELRARGYRVELLDGDEVRKNLSDGLGFTKGDRDRNILRIGYVCKLLSRNGVVAMGAAVSPFREARDRVRKEIGAFVEVYVRCPISVCEARDYKGVYRRFREGKIDHVSGLDDPYEPPVDPEVVVDSDREAPEECASKVLTALEEMGYVAAAGVPTAAYSREEEAVLQKRLEDLGYA
jgi:adenylyl-sulfate kinase